MILWNGKEITEIWARGHMVTAVYKGAKLIWEAMKGLFASRMWTEPKHWTENEDDYWLEQ